MIDGLFNLTGKVALVTGGAKGIGAMMTKGLIESGAKVYVSSRSAEACTQFAQEMSEFGECIALPTNLIESDQVAELIATLEKRENHLETQVHKIQVGLLISVLLQVLFLGAYKPFLIMQARQRSIL